MKIDKFRQRIETHLSKIEDLILSIPQKGDICQDCQRMCLHEALNTFWYTLNGTKQEDLESNEEEFNEEEFNEKEQS